MQNIAIYERAYVAKLFHNQEIREKYLPETVPSVFTLGENKILTFIMRRLVEQKVPVTLDNIVIYYKGGDERLKSFIKRNKIKEMTEDDFANIIFDKEAAEASDKLIDFAIQQTKAISFEKYLNEAIDNIKYWNSYREFGKIITKCKDVVEWYNKLFNVDRAANRDQIREAVAYINSDDEYIRTSSQALNTYIGGWTKGFVAAVIAKSSHNKSTWLTYDIVQGILSKKTHRVEWYAMEETSSQIWRRVFAMICNISTTAMRQKVTSGKITKEHEDLVRKKLESYLLIHDDIIKYNDLLGSMDRVEGDKVVLDHLQSIDYPGTGTFLNRMIGNIPGLIDKQKKMAKLKNIPFINLSQVGDKEIARSERVSKAPRYHDAYASSVLYQASREFLALYYPYKDFEENPYLFNEVPPSDRDFYISIEKSSFSKIGKVKMYYDPDLATFRDAELEHKKLSKMNYQAPKEEEIVTLFTE